MSEEVISVWWADILELSQTMPYMAACLTDDEHRRASRYRRLEDRRRFIACRSMLRQLVACTTHAAPEAVRFSSAEHGKPVLGEPKSSLCQFNVSHTEHIAIAAISQSAAVGVDVEHVRRDIDFEHLISSLTPAEQNALRSVDSTELPSAFFTTWVRKEAFLKASGLGLTLGLDWFEWSDDVPPELRTFSKSQIDTRWALTDLHLPTPQPCKAALVSNARSFHLRVAKFTGSPSDALGNYSEHAVAVRP